MYHRADGEFEEEGGGQYGIHKYNKWMFKDTVSNLLLRIQAVVLILISTCLWGTRKSTPVMTDKDPRLSKYTAQMFDCRVSGKIQLLQIPKTCDGASKEGEMATLPKAYVLSPKKLKKTSRFSIQIPWILEQGEQDEQEEHNERDEQDEQD